MGLCLMGGSVAKAAIRSLPLELLSAEPGHQCQAAVGPLRAPSLLPSPALQLLSSSSANKTLV